MNKEIKIIDLLNMIANGKNIKNIKYQNHIYEYYNGDYREEIDGAYDSNWLFANEIIDLSNLNDEVEIIEDEKPSTHIMEEYAEMTKRICNEFRKHYYKDKEDKKIEKLNTDIVFKRKYLCDDISIDFLKADIMGLSDKINEIIDKINNL